MQSIILTSSNIDTSNGYNNVLKYNFPAGAVNFTNSKIAVASIALYYSWFNITSSITESKYNNNSFQYVWYSGSTSQTYTITIPDGYYSASTLNAYLQSVMITNGHYLTDADGNYVYYLEIVENSSKYSIQLNSYALPTSLPSGYSNPASMSFPATKKTPQFIILSSNNFKDIVGFSAGTYPSSVQTTDYSVTSTYTPEFSPVSSLILLLNILDNRLSNPSSVFFTFSPAGTSYGSLIEVNSRSLLFNKIKDGTYADFTLTITDQNFKPIKIKDTQLTILLTVMSD